ncbi:MAG: hypothetical protein RI952_13 [Bacteroidota bacterium]|jgi:futalosine hydrolase
MKILIVAATEFEIEPLRNQFSNALNERHQIRFLVAGVGMVNTTYQLAKLFTNETFDLVINIGIAGAFDRKLNIGEVVEIKSDLFSEMGAEDDEAFLSFVQLGLQAPKEHPFIWGELVPENTTLTAQTSHLQKVSAITVNKAHGKLASILNTQNLYNPQIESMEGAAFLFCCMKENIPCVQIRSISNFVEKRNKDNWNIPLAIENLHKEIIKILEAI